MEAVEVIARANWPGIQLVERLGGARNVVYRGAFGGREVSIRFSSRTAKSLAWELNLLQHLDISGVRVAVPVPAKGGALSIEGVVVQEWLEGHPPTGVDEWGLVAEALGRIHDATGDWPQRPGSASARDLLTGERGGDVRLDLMPADAVHDIRQGWRPVLRGTPSAIHGDPGAGNVRVHEGQVGFLDWDEARVDVPWFDLAAIPPSVQLDTGTT